MVDRAPTQRWFAAGNALTVVGILLILLPSLTDAGWPVTVLGAVLVLAGSACVGVGIAAARRR